MDTTLVAILLTIVICFFYVCIRYGGSGASEKKELDSYHNKIQFYEPLFKKLPERLVRKYCSLTTQTAQQSGIPVEDLPEILFSTGQASLNVIEQGEFGEITQEQYSKIEKQLNDYDSFMLKTYIPAARTAISDGSQGLDFGIITNSAADMALYKAMDTHEKMKKNNKAVYQFSEKIGQEITSLISAISETVS